MIEIRSQDWKNVVIFAKSDCLGKETEQICKHRQLKNQVVDCSVIMLNLLQSRP